MTLLRLFRTTVVAIGFIVTGFFSERQRLSSTPYNTWTSGNYHEQVSWGVQKWKITNGNMNGVLNVLSKIMLKFNLAVLRGDTLIFKSDFIFLR